MGPRLILPARGAIRPNGPHDPLPYYYRRSVGWLYRHRLQMGLDLLPPRPGTRVLEVGVGSGILIPTLTRSFPDYTGTDLVLAPGLESLVAPGCQASFFAADLLDPEALPAGAFDVVVCFSVLEHIRASEAAARSLARALAPGGTLVAGYPMVNRAMSRAFELLGFPGIEEHHVATPRDIHSALEGCLALRGRSAFPPGAPVRLAVYQCTAWSRRG